ncbi:hypothetical protein LPJ61_005512 [Coemansia biformis]|uniref:Protein SCAI n=1 Tax=Coemansia biformis TaxID=1286918 RepID=A0A9W7Y2Y9_9FUNG|nr:hypothetical protein LPJ61_005512 [Coemansia biformis]
MAAAPERGTSDEPSATGELRTRELPPEPQTAPAGTTAGGGARSPVSAAQPQAQTQPGSADGAGAGKADADAGAPESSREASGQRDVERDGERDREIVEEFEYLLEKSQQLFTGISDLPEIGSKYWLPHFQRTFEVYTKLWRFQSMHRVLLEKPEHYGLKRWEVGEIASKIGQLYYQYYLRTSETNYLQEAFVFYDAIRERSYFKGEQEIQNSALMIKKLRYYARFITVCLQLSNTPMMLQLLEEVRALIDVYATVFNPVDKMEWSLVVKDMSLFMHAVCSPVPTDGASGLMLPATYRLDTRRRARTDKDGARLRLQEAVIVGNRPTQIKFSELTLDMYYMLQMLEREPTTREPAAAASTSATTPAAASTAAAPTEAAPTAVATAEASATAIADVARSPEQPEGTPAATAEPTESAQAQPEPPDRPRPEERERELERAGRRTNPHKYVLYQPSIGQIQVYLASAFREIGDQGCVLLYLSSDGGGGGGADEGAGAAQYGFTGGVSTSRRAAAESGQDRGTEQLVNTVHPADLVPFTRKPFFLIVESNSSTAYRGMANLFNQPLLCLLSPTEYPVAASAGSIYTFFLHSPAVAFCVLSQITSMAAARWGELERRMAAAEDLALELAAAAMPASVRRFLGDDFLRQIIARHVLCCAVLRLHLDFNRPEHWPQASPECFAEALAAPPLASRVRDAIGLCEVDQFYRMADAPDRSPGPPPPPPAASAATAAAAATVAVTTTATTTATPAAAADAPAVAASGDSSAKEAASRARPVE